MCTANGSQGSCLYLRMEENQDDSFCQLKCLYISENSSECPTATGDLLHLTECVSWGWSRCCGCAELRFPWVVVPGWRSESDTESSHVPLSKRFHRELLKHLCSVYCLELQLLNHRPCSTWYWGFLCFVSPVHS